MHRNNLFIEDDCSWGAVEKEPHYVTAESASNLEIIE